MVRKTKKARKRAFGRNLIIVAIVGFLGFTFFGGNEMLTAANNTENYIAAVIILMLVSSFAYGAYTIYKNS